MISKKTLVIIIIVLVAIAILILGISQWFYLRKAHSTFENYYAFRGCAQLLEKTDDYGICETGSGQTVKIVKYENKWYLDGDLPWACLGSMCFGI
ncbi:MAG: hypothetical protein WCF77_05395 [Minisyncoccia bacterium]